MKVLLNIRDHLVSQFHCIRNHSYPKLTQFLNYITYAYMIDNIMLLVTGSLHNRTVNELLPRCHPLGAFDQLGAITMADTPSMLYNAVLVDTPLAPYFINCISEKDLDELNIEIIRNTLYKAYLEDFYRFCVDEIGDATGDLMKDILGFEADRRCFIITINSLDTELPKETRMQLYPTCGELHHSGLEKLCKCEDYEQIKELSSAFPRYYNLFEDSGNMIGDKTIEDRFFEREVELNKNVFLSQFNFAIFFGYIKLKEQEIRNIIWITECIAQQHRARIDNYIPIF
ncbi:hypothetical protein ACOME3_004611 [Neoechinorhynchus agilis]